MSPFDGSEENLFSGISKKQLRKDYQLALQRVDELHASLELCEHFLNENKNGAEQHRMILLNEKEALVNEIERFEMYIRTEEERVSLKKVTTKECLFDFLEERFSKFMRITSHTVFFYESQTLRIETLNLSEPIGWCKYVNNEF